jgi:Tol biopolymer transport system component
MPSYVNRLLALALALAASPVFAQSTSRVDITSAGAEAGGDSFRPTISADGRYVVFSSVATDLVAGDVNGFEDVFVHDRLTGTTTLESVDALGNQANGASRNGTITPDGRFLAYHSIASNLAPNDVNGADDVYLRDRLSGAVERISVSTAGAGSEGLARGATISADGRFVSFTSLSSNLVAGDLNQVDDVFVRDRLLGTTVRASEALGGGAGNADSYFGALSSDGARIVFASVATDLVAGDTNAMQDIFVRDLASGTTVRASVTSGGAQGGGFSFYPAISSDGRWVSFHSTTDDLVPGDTNGLADVFVRDLQLGTTVIASLSDSGALANGASFASAISAHGRYVVFDSVATNLVPGDTNALDDLYLRDLSSGRTERISVASDGAQSDGDSRVPGIDADGRLVVFASAATTLVPGDTNGAIDVYVRDRGILQAQAVCFGDASAACPCANPGAWGHGCDNSAATGGAVLTNAGTHAPDTVSLTAWHTLASSLAIFLQGDAGAAPVAFGDGLRCAAGNLLRLYVHNASGGVVSAPIAGEPSITVRSAALGDSIAPGTTRWYQVYYRDPALAFCPPPAGDAWNASNALAILW